MKFHSTLTVLILTLASSGLFAQSAREISEKAIEVMNIDAMEMISTLKIYDNKGRERVRKVATATKKFKGISKTLIKFLAPADVKGTAMLIYDYDNQDDDMWIYMPALRKTRRIISSDKGKNFMGSEFTNADMTKPDLNDFTYKILSTEIYEGKTCWKIESRCKNEDIEDENGFSKRTSWVENGTWLVHKIEFYNIDGELHKVQIIKQFNKQSNGKYFAFYMEKENMQNGRKSVMTIDQFQGNSDLKESAFAPTVLGD